jgi:hypothetical protein
MLRQIKKQSIVLGGLLCLALVTSLDACNAWKDFPQEKPPMRGTVSINPDPEVAVGSLAYADVSKLITGSGSLDYQCYSRTKASDDWTPLSGQTENTLLTTDALLNQQITVEVSAWKFFCDDAWAQEPVTVKAAEVSATPSDPSNPSNPSNPSDPSDPSNPSGGTPSEEVKIVKADLYADALDIVYITFSQPIKLTSLSGLALYSTYKKNSALYAYGNLCVNPYWWHLDSTNKVLALSVLNASDGNPTGVVYTSYVNEDHTVWLSYDPAVGNIVALDDGTKKLEEIVYTHTNQVDPPESGLKLGTNTDLKGFHTTF